MSNVLQGLAIVLIGVLTVIFHAPIAHNHVRFHNRVWGIDPRELSERATRIGYVVVGLGFIAMGLSWLVVS